VSDFDVFTTDLGAPQELSDEQKEHQAEMDRLYLQVFNTPAGGKLLAVWEAKMVEEDMPRFNIQNSGGFMYYTSGRRSWITAIRKRLNRIKRG
jgi:hypothetical protein